MEYRRLGRSDLHVSSLSMGTMMYGDQVSGADALSLMDMAYNEGVNFYDTAEMYTVPPKRHTHGNSERIVGNWIRTRGLRDKIILASKVIGRSELSWIRADQGPTRLTGPQIMEAIEGSLKRLQVDMIDLYQIHWPDRAVQVFGRDLKGYHHYSDDYARFEDTLGVLQKLQMQGKIRYIGLSNETPYGVMRFLTESERHVLPRVQSIQNAYNLTNRYFEYGLAELAMQEDIGMIAYSPLGQGTLSGKYLNGALPKGSRAELGARPARYDTPSGAEAIAAYGQVAQDFGVDICQMALKFIAIRPWVTTVLFGASNMAQLTSNLASAGLDMTPELEAAINAVHARIPNPCP
jgi:aryl-alcohol dehydrogenase-like predicted oxidoreductase